MPRQRDTAHATAAAGPGKTNRRNGNAPGFEPPAGTQQCQGRTYLTNEVLGLPPNRERGRTYSTAEVLGQATTAEPGVASTAQAAR